MIYSVASLVFFWLLVYLFACVFHELGHYLFAYLFDAKPRFGFFSVVYDSSLVTMREEGAIMIAGPLSGAWFLLSVFAMGVSLEGLGFFGVFAGLVTFWFYVWSCRDDYRVLRGGV